MRQGDRVNYINYVVDMDNQCYEISNINNKSIRHKFFIHDSTYLIKIMIIHIRVNYITGLTIKIFTISNKFTSEVIPMSDKILIIRLNIKY